MVRSSKNYDQVASLELSLQATKSLLSDYALRTRQAEQMASALMSERLTGEQVTQLGQLIASHMDQRSTERAVQQQALLQSTLIVLNSALQGDEQTLRTLVNKVVEQATAALSYMNGTGQVNKPNQG
jgi:hypothetical protein